jgi:hypothetical protein
MANLLYRISTISLQVGWEGKEPINIVDADCEAAVYEAELDSSTSDCTLGAVVQDGELASVPANCDLEPSITDEVDNG